MVSNEEAVRQAIRELIEKELEELTATGAIDGFGTPFAFQGDSEANKKKRKDSAEAVDGFEVIGEKVSNIARASNDAAHKRQQDQLRSNIEKKKQRNRKNIRDKMVTRYSLGENTEMIDEAEKREGFEQKANEFLRKVQSKLNKHYKKSYPNFRENDTKLSFTKGSKFWRIVAVSGSSKSVWGFLDTRNGDILKAAGWKAPAKGARGNIFDPDLGIGKTGPYGPQYKRGPSFGWQENVNEGGDPYYAWRNDDTKSPRMKIGEAIQGMNHQLREMESSVKRCRRLRSEANLATSDYWNRTNNALMKMESRMHNIAKMVRDMRG